MNKKLNTNSLRQKAKICVVFAQHGDEPNSLRIVCDLKKLLAKSDLKDRFIEFIGPVNKAGLNYGLRVEPKTKKDFNRFYPGNINGDAVDRQCFKIFKKCSSADFVLDIHNFVNSKCVNTAYVFNNNNFDVTNRSLSGAVLLQVQMIKLINENERGTLIRELNEINIPGLILETSPIEFITDVEIKKVAKNIISLVRKYSVVPSVIKKQYKVFESVEKIKSPKQTLFVPTDDIQPGQLLKKGMQVGFFIKDNICLPVILKCNGILQAISPAKFCKEETEVVILCKTGLVKT